MGEAIVIMAIGAREAIVYLKGRNVGNRQMANMAKHMVQQEFLKMYGEIRSKYCRILHQKNLGMGQTAPMTRFRKRMLPAVLP